MLRVLVLVFFLANMVFYAWSQGWLLSVIAIEPQAQREPERLEQQLRPEKFQVLDEKALAAERARAALPPPVCVQAGPFSDTEIEAAKAAIADWVPAGSWKAVVVESKPMHWVYMGKMATAEIMAKKADELRRLKVEFVEVKPPSEWAPGYTLGRFATRPEAEEALQSLSAAKGIRTARVLEIPAGPPQQLLRVPSAAVSVANQLKALQIPALGEGFVACPEPGASP
jgi:hypothetical protein